MAKKSEGLWPGGLPYDPQIRAFEEAFPNPQEGQIFDRERLSKLVQAPIASGRYYGIIRSWCKKEFRMRGIVMEWVPEGLKVLNPAEHFRI